MSPLRHRLHCVVVCAVVLCAGQLAAQIRAVTEETDTPPADLYTLHVNANLMQIPTVVLESDLTPIATSIAREKFDITLDGGPIFHPTKLRREGDDPITLAILLEDAGHNKDLVKLFGDALASIATDFLRPSDRVVVYALDCKLFRVFSNAPPTPALMRETVSQVLHSPGLHGEKDKPACGKTVHLWDSIVLISNSLSNAPGRRVLLAVSAGLDHKGNYTLEQASEISTLNSVAVFGMRDEDEFPARVQASPVTTTFTQRNGARTSLNSLNQVTEEDLLDILSQTNGGFVLSTRHQQIDKQLQRLFTVLRNRYVIEFPRPDRFGEGLHAINIAVHGRPAFVKPTGASAPIAETASADETMIRSSPSPAVVGPKAPRTSSLPK